MASPLPYTQIHREDLAGAPDWIDRLLVPLNGNFEAIQTAFRRGLTVAQNLQESLVNVTFTTPANYWSSAQYSGATFTGQDAKIFGYIQFLTGSSTTINTPAVGINTSIRLTRVATGGTAGVLGFASRVNGVSFAITSSSATDTSGVVWELIDPLQPSFTVAKFSGGLPTGVKVTGISVLQLLTSTRAQVLSPVSIAWSEPTLGTPQLDFVSGLLASTTYQMTLRVV